LVDREEAVADWPERLGAEMLAESALTLEELYLALVGKATAPRVAELVS
jgi:hypothetical protein